MATTAPDLDPRTPGVASGNRPRLLMVVGGVLLLLLLVWFFFLRGEDEPETTTTVTPPVVEQTPAEEDPAEARTKEDPVETFEVFAPKDPFDPLISASTGAGGGTATGGGTTVAAGGTTTTPGADGTGTTTTTTTTTNGNGGSGGQDVGGHRVRVVDVYTANGEQRAQVQVDGTVYTVDEGERFADNFQLTSASGRCATMLFGDDEFTLCEGEEILK